jgi:hypothetical protein
MRCAAASTRSTRALVWRGCKGISITLRARFCEPWILDIDTTVKPLYGHQEGAVVSYNPNKRGRPSHSYHCYMMANLRLVLAAEVAPGNQHTSKHSSPSPAA